MSTNAGVAPLRQSTPSTIWAFDKTAGIALDRRIADYVFVNAFGPRR